MSGAFCVKKQAREKLFPGKTIIKSALVAYNVSKVNVRAEYALIGNVDVSI